jgi:hypothetical protein
MPAFLERSGVGVLELPSIVWGFSGKREILGNENPWRCRDGDSCTDRHAPERSCEVRMACAPQSSKRLDFSECVRRFNHHRLRPLLCGWRKPACVDELDSSHCRPGVADFAVDPHLSGKEDTPYGSILNEVTLCVSGRRGSTRKVPLFRVPTRQLMRAVTALIFRLRIDAGCSIFIVPLRSSPSRIFSYGRYHRIST